MLNEFRRQMADLTGYDNYIMSFADQSRDPVACDNYTYTIDGQVLTANITATVSQTFNVVMDTDSDFVITGFAGFARAVASQVMIINPAVLVQITDLSSGKNFFNAPAPMAMICGQGGFDFLLTSPRVIKPRSTLRVTAISAAVQTFSGFFFCFHGSRIFYA